MGPTKSKSLIHDRGRFATVRAAEGLDCSEKANCRSLSANAYNHVKNAVPCFRVCGAKLHPECIQVGAHVRPSSDLKTFLNFRIRCFLSSSCALWPSVKERRSSIHTPHSFWEFASCQLGAQAFACSPSRVSATETSQGVETGYVHLYVCCFVMHICAHIYVGWLCLLFTCVCATMHMYAYEFICFHIPLCVSILDPCT